MTALLRSTPTGTAPEAARAPRPLAVALALSDRVGDRPTRAHGHETLVL